MSTLLFAGTEDTPYISCRRTRPLDRLACRISARRLDQELALGASPDASAALSMHARALIGMRMRCALARTLWRVQQDAHAGNPGFSAAVPVCRPGVFRCRELLGELSSRLSSPGPVNACGVARLRLLLGDGSSPLYSRLDDGALDRALQAVLEGLAVEDS
jgi:hypothetical protein